MEKSINFSSNLILPIGRTIKKDTSLLLGWPGSGFSFTFLGEELRIKFGAFDSERNFYFKIYVDKIIQTHCVCASDQIVVIRGLSLREHNVKVIKITECMQQVEISSITVSGTNAAFLKAEPPRRLKFEFIGDSLTAGFGNRSEPDAGIYRESEQDVTCAYAYLTAESLKAEGRYICCSGKGIFNNWDGSKEHRITTFYEKKYITVDEPHDFSMWKPDIVFINAGTNDVTAQTDPNDFKTAYIDFVKRVHELNPDSIIVCLHGMTTDKFEDTFEEIKTELKKTYFENPLKIDFFRFATISEEFYGALGHPNTKAHILFARDLVKFVKRFLPR